MKRTVLYLLLAISFSSMISAPGFGFSPVGKWTFSAVGAPPEYEKGIFEISSENDRYLVYIVFDGIDYKIPCEKVIYDGEKLSFSLFLDIDEIFIVLKFEGEDKLAGRASTPDGEIPLTLERVKVQN